MVTDGPQHKPPYARPSLKLIYLTCIIAYSSSLHAAVTADSFSWITLAVQIRFSAGVLGAGTSQRNARLF